MGIDIILINPPQRSRSQIILPPLGLAYLASSLMKAGYRVEILDAPARGMKLPDLENEVRRRKPELLGIGGMTPNFDLTEAVIRIARSFTRYLLAGGPHVSAIGATLLSQMPELDFLVAGEGEETLAELVRALDSSREIRRIKGVISRENLNLSPRPPIENLDQIPFPAWELLPQRRYRHPVSPSSPVATMITSRGCPYRCVFCDRSVFGNSFRFRSPGNVADEIESLVKRFRLREFIFYDDNFLFPAERAMALAGEIIRRGLKIGFRCESRVDNVNPELLKAIRSAGCHTIAYGVESANPHGLEFLRKGFTAGQAQRAVELTQQAGIQTVLYFILGIPVESREDMKRTLDFALALNPAFAQFSILSPTPGSELLRRAQEYRPLSSPKVKNPFDQDRSRLYLSSPYWDEADLNRILRKAYVRFYLRMGFFRQIFRNRAKLSAIRQIIAGGIQILRWLICKN